MYRFHKKNTNNRILAMQNTKPSPGEKAIVNGVKDIKLSNVEIKKKNKRPFPHSGSYAKKSEKVYLCPSFGEKCKYFTTERLVRYKIQRLAERSTKKTKTEEKSDIDKIKDLWCQLENKLKGHPNSTDILISFDMYLHAIQCEFCDVCNYRMNDKFFDTFINNPETKFSYHQFFHVFDRKHFCSYGPVNGDESYDCRFYSQNAKCLSLHKKKCEHRTICIHCGKLFSKLKQNKEIHEKQCESSKGYDIELIETILDNECKKLQAQYNDIDMKHPIFDNCGTYEDYITSLKCYPYPIDYQQNNDNVFLMMHKIRESANRMSFNQESFHCPFADHFVQAEEMGLHAKIYDYYKSQQNLFQQQINTCVSETDIIDVRNTIIDTLQNLGYVNHFFGPLNFHVLENDLMHRNIDELNFLKTKIEVFGNYDPKTVLLLKKIIQFDAYYVGATILYNFYIHENTTFQDKYFSKVKSIYSMDPKELIDFVLELKNEINLSIFPDNSETIKIAKLFYILIYGFNSSKTEYLYQYGLTDKQFNDIDIFFEKIELDITSIVKEKATRIRKIFYGVCSVLNGRQNVQRYGECKFGCGFNDKKNMSRHHRTCSFRTHCNFCKMNYKMNGFGNSGSEKQKHESICKHYTNDRKEKKMVTMALKDLKQKNSEIVHKIEERKTVMRYLNRQIQCYHCLQSFHSYDAHFETCHTTYPTLEYGEKFQECVQNEKKFLKELKNQVCSEIDFYKGQYRPFHWQYCTECEIKIPKQLIGFHDTVCSSLFKKIIVNLQDEKRALVRDQERKKVVHEIKFKMKYYKFLLNGNTKIQSYMRPDWETFYTLKGASNKWTCDPMNTDYGLECIFSRMNQFIDVHKHPEILIINIYYNIFIQIMKDPNAINSYKDWEHFDEEREDYYDLYKRSQRISDFQHQCILENNYKEILYDGVYTHETSKYLARLKTILKKVIFRFTDKNWTDTMRKSTKYNDVFVYKFDKKYVIDIFSKNADEIVYVHDNLVSQQKQTFPKLDFVADIQDTTDSHTKTIYKNLYDGLTKKN